MSRLPIEFAISVLAQPKGLLFQQELEPWEGFFEKTTGEHCNLYFLVGQHRASIADGELIPVEKNKVAFRAQIHSSAGTREQAVLCEPEVDPQVHLSYECPAPHQKLVVKREDEPIATWSVADLAVHTCEELRSLEVLYIGQTFGPDGFKPIRERLAAHKTLQRIYADMAEDRPYTRVRIMPAVAEPVYFTLITGDNRARPVNDDDLEMASKHLTDDPMPIDQRVNLGEAALIRHFRPEYNVKFKDNFPDRTHISYDHVFLQNYNAVLSEVPLEYTPYLLQSSSVPATSHPIAEYSLVTEHDRTSMLDPSTWWA